MMNLGIGLGVDHASPMVSSSVLGGQMLSSAPAGYDAWLAAVTAAGATPTATDTAAVSALLTSLASAGFLLADFDYIYLMIGSNPADTATNRYNQKRINLVNPGTFDATITNPNASGHVATGTQGNASMYWDTGLNTGTRITNRDNNASWGCAVTAFPDNGAADGGWEANASITGYMFSKSTTNSFMQYGLNSLGSMVTQCVPPCLFYGNSPSSSTTIYSNTTSLGAAATATTAQLAARSSYIYTTNFANTGVVPRSNGTYAMHWHGRSFSAGERTAWYSIWQTFLAAYSVTI
jgi:hypothetical protein